MMPGKVDAMTEGMLVIGNTFCRQPKAQARGYLVSERRKTPFPRKMGGVIEPDYFKSYSRAG